MSTRAGTPRTVTLPRWRITALLLIAVLGLVGVGVRLVDIQIVRGPTLAEWARREFDKPQVIPARRGTITDARGNVLAMDVELQSLYAVPYEVVDPEKTALTLAPLVKRDAGELLRLLDQPLQWVRVARWLDPQTAAQIDALDIRGLRLEYEPRRIYPQGTYAAQVIGFTNDEFAGVAGVEAAYHALLAGTPGSVQGEWDAQSNPIWLAPPETSPPQDGVDLQLTIDPLVQHIIEAELARAVTENHAESGTIIVLQPDTGAILGMASVPTFDPNNYAQYSPDLIYRNPAVASLYEPGSTFKIVTVAAGLQARAFTADTLVSDTGTIFRYGTSLSNWNGGANGMINSQGVLYHSSNVGALQLNELTGAEAFYDAVRAFGFGATTGVDLPGEEPGLVNDPGSPGYTPVTLLTNSYGQGIAVTPLQLVRAVAAIANGGSLVRPYVVAQRCQHGVCSATQPEVSARVVEPGVAWTVRRMLVHSANHYAPVVWGPRTGNYGDQYLVPGYEVCAKTGTSSIPVDGRYDASATIGSVVGFGPAEDARFVVLVKIDRPRDDIWGVTTAIPVYHAVMAHLLRYERLRPDPALVSPGQEVAAVTAGTH